MTAAVRLLFAALATLAGGQAVAGSRPVPAPALVIYPGDKITDSMLSDLQGAQGDLSGMLWERADIVGKVARRTLLPGRPIPAIAVEEARAVSMGALVTLVYNNEGVSIVTKAQALQNGYVGQMVQVRNLESGTIVTGAIQADGSVLVNGG